MAEWIDKFESRVHKTARTRAYTARRLSARDNTWNVFLISFSLSTVIATIAVMADVTIYGPKAELLLVCCSIVSLVGSVVVSSRRYGARSQAVFQNHLDLQALAARIEVSRELADLSDEVRAGFVKDYHTILDGAENQSQGDYGLAIPPTWVPDIHARKDHLEKYGTTNHLRALVFWRAVRSSGAVLGDSLVTYGPLVALAVPILLSMPIVYWLFRAHS